jgi:hypothetical protein
MHVAVGAIAASFSDVLASVLVIDPSGCAVPESVDE